VLDGTSLGKASQNFTYVDWFEYKGNDEVHESLLQPISWKEGGGYDAKRQVLFLSDSIVVKSKGDSPRADELLQKGSVARRESSSICSRQNNVGLLDAVQLSIFLSTLGDWSW
jgi:hypothetical protein